MTEIRLKMSKADLNITRMDAIVGLRIAALNARLGQELDKIKVSI